MSTATIDPDRLAKLDEINLHSGNHRSFAEGHCAMEVVAWLAGEGHTDAPSCASPVLRRFTIRLNDRWDTEQRQALKPYLPRMVGTAGDGKDPLREKIAGAAVVELVSPWLRLADLNDQADALEAVPAGDVAAVRAAMRRASEAAWNARRASLEDLKTKVRMHLKDRADAVAVAVAVAVAAAPGDKYFAAYKAARAYFDEHPLGVTDRVASLASEQRGAALQLLDRLIDPAA